MNKLIKFNGDFIECEPLKIGTIICCGDIKHLDSGFIETNFGEYWAGHPLTQSAYGMIFRPLNKVVENLRKELDDQLKNYYELAEVLRTTKDERQTKTATIARLENHIQNLTARFIADMDIAYDLLIRSKGIVDEIAEHDRNHYIKDVYKRLSGEMDEFLTKRDQEETSYHE